MTPHTATREAPRDHSGARDASIASAVRRLADDGLVAYPTETVWGLAARAQSEPALEALRRWKGRAQAQPISVLVPEGFVQESGAFELDAAAEALIEAFWPGPLTLVMPCRMNFAAGIARADGAVGVRCSSHPRAAALVRAAHAAGLGPITATSLNRHGEPPARSASQARALCAADGADAPLLLETLGEDARDEAPTSVLDLASDPPALLRRGALSPEAIEGAAGIALRLAGEPAPMPSDVPPSGARTTPGEESE